ncbi:uncharacterized protein METZ01_LOCUS46058 [marine metagenome]|uniref:Uncharacterized protein n=1 Tax=marine metagenome TaxID=408172 RepID=A0A381RPM4_9ZZZZ
MEQKFRPPEKTVDIALSQPEYQ